MRALFVYNPADLEANVPGGVQRCTAEFLDVVECASSSLIRFPITYARRLATRLKRRTRLFPYIQYDAGSYRESLQRTIVQHRIDTVFLNRAELLRFAAIVGGLPEPPRIVLMSHGNESGDLLYEIAVHRRDKHSNPLSRLYDFLWLGGDLALEARLRRETPFTVVAMSEEEAVLERWLGASDVFVLPRILQIRPVAWNPEPMRVGYIGSLHHTPNIVALEAVLDGLESCGAAVRVEVIGHPVAVGEQLSRRYPFVDYHGPLSDKDLVNAVGRWSLFLNPIFWLAKGASMKLGDALSRGLPVLTTLSGLRGYELPPGCVFVTADRVDEFVARIVSLSSDMDALVAARQRTIDAVDDMPDAGCLGKRLRDHLERR